MPVLMLPIRRRVVFPRMFGVKIYRDAQSIVSPFSLASMRFNTESAKRAVQRKAALGAAKYWRERGFANLVLARAVAKANRERRKLGILPADQDAAYDDAAGNPDSPLNPDAPIVPKPVE